MNEEIFETGGLKRILSYHIGHFDKSPDSFDVSLFVFIDANLDENTYIIEYAHIDKEYRVVDKTETYDELKKAVNRFDVITKTTETES